MKVLIPLPAYGFDPTETAIPWTFLDKQGHEVIFATPTGEIAAADARMLTGGGLGIWKGMLKAREDAVIAYQQMIASDAFRKPISYAQIDAEKIGALLLAGGHDKGVKSYLESKILQKCLADFFVAKKPIAAICHGVVLAARSIDPATNKSVLYNYDTTCLLASQERLAYRLTKNKVGDYYLTYPGLTVEQEVRAVLKEDSQFKKGSLPLMRDSQSALGRGFVVRDKNYLSARWPGDVYQFANSFLKMLEP